MDCIARGCAASRLLVFAICALAASGCGDDDRRRGPVDGAVPPRDAGPRPDGAPPLPDGSPGVDAAVDPSPWVDPTCLDGMYSESPLPNPSASLDDLVAGWSGDYQTFVDQSLERRYAIGAEIVRRGRRFAMLGDCVERFIGSPGSPDDVFRRMGTVVHECGHFADIAMGSGASSYYLITPETTFTCAMGDTTTRGGRTFARSRINGDAYASMRPPCGGSAGSGCDFYADVYLDGDPDDGTFEGGDQGFNSVLEETTQYVNSLATGYAFNDRYSGSVSERDGILTFLWYLERYLRLARTSYPDAYAHISGDACWRRAVLTIWGRAWLYLGLTEALPQLGIDDDRLLELVTDAELLGEIERLREAEGC